MVGRFGLLITLAAALLLACAGVVLAQQSAPVSSLEAGEEIPDRWIVVLNDDVTNPRAVARDMAWDLNLRVTHVYRNSLKGFAARAPEGLDLPTELSSDTRVEFVVQDLVIEASAQELPTGVDRIEADLSSTQAGDGSGAVDADVAILDTGIDNHKDLNIAGGHNCLGGGGRSDGNGHGTHVAGTAAAQDNSVGVVGVAPGARLWAVKVLNSDGSGSFSSVICGVDWVTGKADIIEVANMSLGATVTGVDDNNCGWTLNNAARTLHRAICNSVAAGVFYAVSAGNDSHDFLTDVPAAFNEVLTVTAMADFDGEPGGTGAPTCEPDQDDTNADFSNHTAADPNDDDHTIAAPGVCITSTWKNGNYRTISGTSMASPHVAGTAALCIASGACSGSPSQIMTKLRSDAAAQPASYGFVGDPQHPPGNPIYYGFLVYAGGY